MFWRRCGLRWGRCIPVDPAISAFCCPDLHANEIRLLDVVEQIDTRLWAVDDLAIELDDQVIGVDAEFRPKTIQLRALDPNTEYRSMLVERSHLRIGGEPSRFAPRARTGFWLFLDIFGCLGGVRAPHRPLQMTRSAQQPSSPDWFVIHFNQTEL